METSTIPYILTHPGIGLVVELTGTGRAIGTAPGSMATVGALKKRPSGFGSFIVLATLPGSQGLYGFTVFYYIHELICPGKTLIRRLQYLTQAWLLGR
ncbi:MAG TPA: hypothetical protein PKC30_11425 [Saprospiraceae bacterium]|nr:hypothetical protein [Saprospiraceae bacterium]